MDRDDLAAVVGAVERARVCWWLPAGTTEVQMQGEAMKQRIERRNRNRRTSQALFYDFPTDRRRREYERRGRTAVLPMPTELALRGDQRRFEEHGTE